MLIDVLGVYLQTLTEREFDAPFMSLLRSQGYFDIHFTHGAYEFGKDFVAKREGTNGIVQAAFQTKVGNLATAGWREARTQIDEMRTNNLAHPNFDPSLEREVIFVTTGRLTGGAPVSAQEYGRHLQGLGEGSFEIWDRDFILNELALNPDIGLVGRLDDQVIRFSADLASGLVTISEIERLSRTWMRAPLSETAPRGAAVAAVMANLCRCAHRVDLAAHVSLGLLRAAIAWSHQGGAADADAAAALRKAAGGMFLTYASLLSDSVTESGTDPEALLGSGAEFACWISYPVRVLRTTEILALLYVALEELGLRGSVYVRTQVEELVRKNPGANHPVSDNYALSILITSAALRHDRRLLGQWARLAMGWTADRYEDAPGLAPAGSAPQLEIEYIFAAILDGIDVSHRRVSLVATALLDVATAAQDHDLYDDLFNEAVAVKLVSHIVDRSAEETPYAVSELPTHRQVIEQVYDDPTGQMDSWDRARHHRVQAEPDSGRHLSHWEHFALSSLVRDRWSVQRLKTWLDGNGVAGQERS